MHTQTDTHKPKACKLQLKERVGRIWRRDESCWWCDFDVWSLRKSMAKKEQQRCRSNAVMFGMQLERFVRQTYKFVCRERNCAQMMMMIGGGAANKIVQAARLYEQSIDQLAADGAARWLSDSLSLSRSLELAQPRHQLTSCQRRLGSLRLIELGALKNERISP